jgi:DNA-binding SARP family transcriptional activator
MEFRILGPIEVRDGERLLTPTAPRHRALLGALLLHAGETVSREVLVDAVWGDTPPERPATALRTQIQGLRRALEPEREPGESSILVTEDAGLRLCVDPQTVDLCRFERLAAEARSLVGADPVRASALLREASSLWRGPALTGVALAGAAAGEAARLTRLRLAAVEDRIQADLGMGRSTALIPELEALVVAHPQSERLLAQLMLALHRSGRSQDALAAFATSRRRAEPSPELCSLEQAIRDRDPELIDPAAPSTLTVLEMPVPAAALAETVERSVTHASPAPDEDPATVLMPSTDGPATVVTAAVTAPARRRLPRGVLAGAAAFLIGSSMGVVIHHLRASGGPVDPTPVRAAIHTSPPQPPAGGPPPAATPAPPSPPAAAGDPATTATVASAVVPDPTATAPDPSATTSPADTPPPPAPPAPATTRTTPSATPAATPAAAAHPAATTAGNAHGHGGDRSSGWDAFRHLFDGHDDDPHHPHH